MPRAVPEAAVALATVGNKKEKWFAREKKLGLLRVVASVCRW